MEYLRNIAQKAIIIIGVLILLFVGVAAFFSLSFSGVFDKKYTREELTDNFNQHEKEFEELYTCFVSATSKDTLHSVSFSLGRYNKVNISLYSLNISPENNTLGGENLDLDSREMDTVLATIGWTKETVINLRDKLSKIKCDEIRRIEGESRVSVYPYQTGWGSYTYIILNRQADSTIIKNMGRTISNSPFGKQVELVYSSAL